ncbi:hypothetical protein bcgnr5372_33990 [Bacillus luti]|nr:hypothetical protein [Bacillus cereus]HDR8329570.1 hypothetical protein [Bacillus cereus]HDR8332899.1 hypothetical protein [Bacillus cereus]
MNKRTHLVFLQEGKVEVVVGDHQQLLEKYFPLSRVTGSYIFKGYKVLVDDTMLSYSKGSIIFL